MTKRSYLQSVRSILHVGSALARQKKIKGVHVGRFKITGGNEHLHSVTEKYPKVSTNQEQQEAYNKYLKGKGSQVAPPKAKYIVRTHNSKYTKLMEERRDALKNSNALCSSAIKAIKGIRKSRTLSLEAKESLIQILLRVKTDEERFRQGEQFFLRKNPKRSDHKLATGRVGFLKKNLAKIKSELFVLCERDQIITKKTLNELIEIFGHKTGELPHSEWPGQPTRRGWTRYPLD